MRTAEEIRARMDELMRQRIDAVKKLSDAVDIHHALSRIATEEKALRWVLNEVRPSQPSTDTRMS